MSFALRLLERGVYGSRSRIGLVPCAIGGSSIAEWQPGSPNYMQMVRLCRYACCRAFSKCTAQWALSFRPCYSGADTKSLWHCTSQSATSRADAITLLHVCTQACTQSCCSAELHTSAHYALSEVVRLGCVQLVGIPMRLFLLLREDKNGLDSRHGAMIKPERNAAQGD